jgi:Skp family chaperone for outer membrane proteins
MFRSALIRVLVVFCMLLVAPSAALAELKVAVVDFQQALTEIDEGATAMARLEGVRDEKMRNIEAKRQELTAAALASKQQEFEQKAMAFQQQGAQAEMELQNQYLMMMEEFFAKLSAVAEEIGKERGYNLVLEATESGVVFNQGVDDITAELVKRYNARHSVK